MLANIIVAAFALFTLALKLIVVGICIALAYFLMLMLFGINYQLKGGKLPLWTYIIKVHKRLAKESNKFFGIK